MPQTVLRCIHCDGDVMTPLVQLVHIAGQGNVTKQIGWACYECGEQTDQNEMLQKIRIQERQQELDELIEEQKALQPKRMPRKKKTASSNS